MWAEIAGAIAMTLTLPGSAYLAVLTAAASLPARRPAAAEAGALQARVHIVVPAHNESTGLLRTLHSLAAEAAADGDAQVVVIADNCSDDTAEVARAAGVQVIERRDPLLRGKGHALRFAFEQLPAADWFIIIDADTDVAPGFLAEMRRGMAGGADALQCRYGVRDPFRSSRSTLADIALAAWNTLRPRGRAALGLSAGILGNGFALSRAALRAVPYSACSIVEDVEYHHLLVQAGLRVDWIDATSVRGDMPEQRGASAQQRARWEGGRLRLLADRAPSLLAAVLRGHWRQLDALLDLLLLPLSWHGSLLLVAALIGVVADQPWLWGTALAGLLVMASHVLLAMSLLPAGRAHWRALLGVPSHVLWKLRLAGATWRSASRSASWVRSARNPFEPPAP